MTRFSFSDLHSYKDYVVFAQTYLPDRFPNRGGVSQEEQWSLERAFKGLRLGLEMARKEKGELAVFAHCGQLVEEAYVAYSSGDMRKGFFKLEEMQELLKRVPSL
jgi:hypothetical protein